MLLYVLICDLFWVNFYIKCEVYVKIHVFKGNSQLKGLPRRYRTCLWMHVGSCGSLGLEDPLEEGTATHSSILAWSIPWTDEPGGLQSLGSQIVGHDQEHTHVHTWHFNIVFQWHEITCLSIYLDLPWFFFISILKFSMWICFVRFKI